MSELHFDEFDQTNKQKSSYRPKGYDMSPGLIRARRRFFIPNLMTGLALAAFSFGVWAYSISAVKQDVFSDIDEEAMALNTTIVQDNTMPIRKNHDLSSTSTPRKDHEVMPRGIAYRAFSHRFPWLFEPLRKTMVWGAPPIDNIGRVGDAPRE